MRPLAIAAYNNRVDVVRMLLDEGAKVDAVDKVSDCWCYSYYTKNVPFIVEERKYQIFAIKFFNFCKLPNHQI